MGTNRTRLIFFQDSINSERYMEKIFEQLTDEQWQAFFQQDSTTTHIARTSIVTSREMFWDRTIGDLWPACSLYLNQYDFYLWGTLKQKVYRSETTEEMKDNT